MAQNFSYLRFIITGSYNEHNNEIFKDIDRFVEIVKYRF